MSFAEVYESVARAIPNTMNTMQITVSIIPNRTTGHICFGMLAEMSPPIETKKAIILKDIRM